MTQVIVFSSVLSVSLWFNSCLLDEEARLPAFTQEQLNGIVDRVLGRDLREN